MPPQRFIHIRIRNVQVFIISCTESDNDSGVLILFLLAEILINILSSKRLLYPSFLRSMFTNTLANLVGFNSVVENMLWFLKLVYQKQ
jgi:hypothetical protein